MSSLNLDALPSCDDPLIKRQQIQASISHHHHHSPKSQRPSATFDTESRYSAASSLASTRLPAYSTYSGGRQKLNSSRSSKSLKICFSATSNHLRGASSSYQNQLRDVTAAAAVSGAGGSHSIYRGSASGVVSPSSIRGQQHGPGGTLSEQDQPLLNSASRSHFLLGPTKSVIFANNNGDMPVRLMFLLFCFKNTNHFCQMHAALTFD